MKGNNLCLTKKNFRRLPAILLAVLMISAIGIGFAGTMKSLAYEERSAYVSADGGAVNVRDNPGTTGTTVVATLNSGTIVTIIGEKNASDGAKWFEIRFTVSGKSKTGYMHSAYLMYTDYSGIEEDDLASFEELLAEFPESYQEKLLLLHDMYPNWKFVCVPTGLDWETALNEESAGYRSLVERGTISSYKSTADYAYDWNTSTWYGIDGDNWVVSSREINAYYMDPRNYLDGSLIFAFLTQEYDEEDQTIEGIKSVIGGSFMKNDFTEGDKTYSYAEVLMEAGKTYGVSPYVLAAMIRIEIGYDGNNASITGTEKGYENLYNYYNVGAWAEAGKTPNERGLWWANGAGTGDVSYGRPWNTRYKALLGGAEYYATNYVNRGQNTLYLKRFNVTSENTYNHQYMTNIRGAASEANVYSLAYTAEAKQQAMVFYIPTYENMPASPVEKPTKNGSPNNKLASITIDGTAIEGFDMNTQSYAVTVSSGTASVKIGATAKDSTCTMQGLGNVNLVTGENTFVITAVAQNGDLREYTIVITREYSSNAYLKAITPSAGTLSPEFASKTYAYTLTVPYDCESVTFKITKTNSQATYTIDGPATLAYGENVYTIKVTAGNGTTTKTYTITVTREEPSKVAWLKSLTVSAGTLSPAFAYKTLQYTVTVPCDVETIDISATPSNSQATFVVSGPDTLAHGENLYSIKVTAGNGTTTKTYKVTVTRETNSDADLSELTVSEGKLMPAFNSDTTEYTVRLNADVETVTIGATADHEHAGVSGTGEINLNESEGPALIAVTAEDGTEKIYSITFERLGSAESVSVLSESLNLREDDTICGLSEIPMDTETFLSRLTVEGGSVILKDKNGSEKTSGNIATGDQLCIYNENEELCSVRTVVIYGDVNGDGVIDDFDFLRVLKHIMGYINLTGENLEASDANRDGTTDDFDFLRILKYIMGYNNITIKQE